MHDRRHSGTTLHQRNSTGPRSHWRMKGEGSMISGDLPQNDGMEHEGHHQHVAGSGTAEGFSREGSRDGSDTDGRNAKDAAHALLEGLTASGASGAAGMGDDARGGGEGHGDLDSDRKGHDEEQTLLGGVGNLMTRARRGVNKYFSALAREQKKIAREQRNRARRSQSSNFDFLVGAEEGVGLLSVASAGDGDADAHKGGRQPASGAPIHRSQSAVFVPARPAVQQASSSSSAVVLGVGAVEVAGGQADTSKSSYATRSRAEPVQGETSMEGGGQVRLKERDFVRMYHDEKQGAGEHSAQDENRERKENGRRSVEPVRSARKPRKVNSMPQLKSCEANDGDWKNMGPDHWADHGFKVLGVEIGHLPEHQQVTLLAGGVFFFLLIYGYMQEYLVVKVFEKKMGLFMTFLQFFGYAACAALRRGIHRETGRKGPLRAYFGLGLLQAVMQGLTNVSMMYLNYPAKVLFKSSRMVPIMCFGVVWQGRKYSLRDCSVVFLIVIGLATFMNAEARSSAATDTPCSLLGVACISLALVIDAANINLQEEVMNRYASCQDELIMFSYLCGTVYVAAFCIFSGELVSGFMFLHGKGTWAIGAVMLYCGSGFLGGSCAVALTKRFGALHSAITTTARKAVTLMLSFVYFQKALTPQHIVGATVFMVGLMGKIFGKGSSKSSGRAPSANTSPSVTPFLNQKYRKHLSDDVEESDPYASSSAALLPGGSGGGGTCNGGGGGGGRGGNGIAPSTVGREDSSTLAGNSGGHPVRHRGNPNGSGSEMDGDVRGGTGSRSGRWVRQKQVSPPRSPLRNRIASPPVTGLGYMIA